MPLMEIIPLFALRDNYIWAINNDKSCVIVDPGEASPVFGYLAASGKQLTAILITHHHEDHKAGAKELTQKTGAGIWGPHSPLIPEVTHPLDGGEEFRLPGLPFPIQALSVPGHTQEHLAYLLGNALFCGDTLFGAGCGRLLGGSPEQLHASLKQLARLPANTLIYSAHEYTLGNLRFAQVVEPDNPAIAERRTLCEKIRQQGAPSLPSTLSEELGTNPFLRVSNPVIRKACETRSGTTLETDEAVFKVLRRWKDQF